MVYRPGVVERVSCRVDPLELRLACPSCARSSSTTRDCKSARIAAIRESLYLSWAPASGLTTIGSRPATPGFAPAIAVDGWRPIRTDCAAAGGERAENRRTERRPLLRRMHGDRLAEHVGVDLHQAADCDAARPPVATNSLTGTPPSRSMSTIQRRPNAEASISARYRWCGPCSSVRPVNAPRSVPSISGVRQPLNQSSSSTPSAPGGSVRRCSVSDREVFVTDAFAAASRRRRRPRPGRFRSRSSRAECRPSRRRPRRAPSVRRSALSMWQLLVPITITSVPGSAAPAPGTPAWASMMAALTGVPAAGRAFGHRGGQFARRLARREQSAGHLLARRRSASFGMHRREELARRIAVSRVHIAL